MDLRRNLGCSAFWTVVFAILVSYLAVGSLNPLAVFATNNLIAKILVGILGASLVLNVLGVLALGLVPEDAVCGDPDCGKSVRAYMLVYGGFMVCPICHTWYHGTCWKRNHGCAACQARAAQRYTQFDDIEELYRRLNSGEGQW